MTDRALERFEALFGPEFGHGKTFDLAKLRACLAALGNPHDKLPPVIHVAGTNGKGSTIAFMRAIAEAASLKVHAFTKPHLFGLRERFTVSSAPADDEALIDIAQQIAGVAPDLTQFDAQVAAAFMLFSAHPADLVLLETGMGGRDDSTNVIARPALSVITPIALDHQDALGPRLEDIAGVGPTRRRKLLAAFGGLDGVRDATVEDLCRVDGINRHLAEQIYNALR